MTVRAKMVCTGKAPRQYQKSDGTSVEAFQLTFRAVFPQWNEKLGRCDHDANCPENKIFGEATPSADLSMFVVNPDATAQFEVGKEYYLDFNPVQA